MALEAQTLVETYRQAVIAGKTDIQYVLVLDGTDIICHDNYLTVKPRPPHVVYTLTGIWRKYAQSA